MDGGASPPARQSILRSPISTSPLGTANEGRLEYMVQSLLTWNRDVVFTGPTRSVKRLRLAKWMN